jgi:hypothetical protein
MKPIHRSGQTLLLGGVTLLVPVLLAGQTNPGVGKPDNTAYGTTSAEFLLLGAGARGTALGTSYAASVTDAASLYYNPAGAALGTRASLVIGTYNYVADTRYSWGGIVFPFGGNKAIGLQLGTFGFKDQPIYTVEQPNGTGATYSVNETFAGLTFAQQFSDRFSAGITGKAVFDQLGSVSGKAFAIDFGADFHSRLSGHPVRMGFTIQNLGTTLKYSGGDLNKFVVRDSGGAETVPVELKTKSFSLPTVFQVAVAYDLLHAAGNNSQLTMTSSFNQANNNKAGFGFAGEWTLRHLGGSAFGAAVRGSYNWAPANNVNLSSTIPTALTDEENLQGLAAGGGLAYDTSSFLLGFDYAFKYMGVLGATHFVSVSLGW